MNLSDENIRSLFQESSNADRSKCLSADELHLAASNQLSSEKSENVSVHLASCNNCIAEYKVLRSLRDWAEQEAGDLIINPTPVKTSWTSRLAWLLSPRYAVSAAILILFLISLPLLIRQTRLSSNVDIYNQRGGGAVDLISEPADRAQLPGPPEKLSWTSPDTAYGYKVALYDFESSLIWESGLIKENSIEIPAEIRARLRPGQLYYWRVLFLNGSPRQSKLLQFKLL